VWQPFKKSVSKDSRSGLSIDDSRVSFARVQRVDGGVLRLAAVTVDQDPNNEKWAHQLAARMKRIDIEQSRVTWVLPDGSYQLLLVEVPNVPANEINSAARWQIKDLLDFPVDDTVVQLFKMPEQSTQDPKPMAYAVATQRSSVEKHAELLHGAGFPLDTIDIPELCTRNIATLLPQDAGGVAFFHFTETHGILTVTRQGVLYLIRRIDIGRRAIKSASNVNFNADDFNVDLAVTAVLEVEESSGDQEGFSGFTANSTQTELISAIVLEIQRSLDFYESHFAYGPPTELVLSPGSDIAGLARSLSEQLGVTVSNLDLNKLFQIQPALSPVGQGACLLAVGAALRSASLAA
jgi:MSHA biogenesis protein MshI